MTPKTLRQERIEKFLKILEDYYQDNPPTKDATEYNTEVAELLADAAPARTEKKAEETPEEYNADVMRGDYNDYPEHVREYAKVLRDVWMFTLPPKPKAKGKKSSEKGRYAFFIMSLESIKQSCAEFGTDVLVKLHADWRAAFRDGIAPYTIAQPTSLINVAAGKAREMREGVQSVQSSHRSERLEREL